MNGEQEKQEVRPVGDYSARASLSTIIIAAAAVTSGLQLYPQSSQSEIVRLLRQPKTMRRSPGGRKQV